MNEAKIFAMNFLIAGFTSSIAKTLCAPFDRVKLILQNQDSSIQVIKGNVQRCTGIINCFIRIPREQGFSSFWRGNGVNIIRYFPTQSLNFSFNHFFKEHINDIFQPTSIQTNILLKIVAGGMAGCVTSSIIFPLDFCQTRVAVDMGSGETESTKREFKGLSDCIKRVKTAEGISGLYRGFSTSVLGVTIYRALYFGLFDGIKIIWVERTHPDVEKPPLLLGLLFAQIATTVAGTCSYPLDTLGRRLMMDAGRPPHLKLFDSTQNPFTTLYKAEGFLAFYKGVAANCLRSLSGALILVFYDEVLDYTNWNQIISSCDN